MTPLEDGCVLVLYDGVCGFCDGTVRWLMDRDTQRVFRFAPLQGGTAAQLRERHAEIPSELETLVVVEADAGGERVHLRSDAVLRVAAHLPGGWRALRHARLLPRFLREWLYRGFARIRYRVFGRLDNCRVPTPDERARILP